MIASIFYPVGIGKHIVCIYADLMAAVQTACRGEPRTPKRTNKGNKMQRMSTAGASCQR